MQYGAVATCPTPTVPLQQVWTEVQHAVPQGFRQAPLELPPLLLASGVPPLDASAEPPLEASAEPPELPLVDAPDPLPPASWLPLDPDPDPLPEVDDPLVLPLPEEVLAPPVEEPVPLLPPELDPVPELDVELVAPPLLD